MPDLLRDQLQSALGATTLTRVSPNGNEINPEWSPDGRRLLWTARGQPARLGTWWRPWDLSAPAEWLSAGVGAKFAGTTGFLSAMFRTGDAFEARLVRVGTDTGSETRTLIPATSRYHQQRPSPDGAWLALASDEDGTREVYVQRIAGTSARFQVSASGGTEPVWGRDGRELFYRSGAAFIAARLTLTPEFAVLRRDTLFTLDAPLNTLEASYDVMPNGEELVLARPVRVSRAPVLVLGWGEEVRERVVGQGR